MRLALALLLYALLATRVQAASDAPFLWKVEGPKATHYLLGSVHLLPESVYPLPAALDAAYTQTAALVLETDPAALSAPETQKQMLDAGLAKDGLAKQITPELLARVRRHAESAGLPPELCDRFKPWFCALTLGVFEFQRAGMDPGFGLDQHFHRRAITDRRTVTWLEEPQAQLALFSGMNASMAEQFLASSLDDLARPELRPDALVKLWQDNDTARLAALIDANRDDFPETHARLLVDRNRAWIDVLAEKFSGNTPQLVVVGAAHLVGEDSVVALLAARGFTPRAVAHSD